MIADLIHKIASFDQEDHVYYPRPSLAGTDRCIRQMVYWGLGFERTPLPGRTLVIFSDSSFHEDLTLDWLRKSAFKVHSEQMKVDCKYPMRTGSIDALITDMTGRDWLLEHKAINHFTFEKYWNGEIPNDYFSQTCIYYDALLKVSADIAGAILLIKNKNTAAYLEYLITYDGLNYVTKCRTNSQGETKQMNVILENIVDKSCDKFLTVTDYINKKTLPKRQYEVDDWQCNYCGYSGHCWGDYQKEFFELKTDAMLPEEVATMVKYYKELGSQKSDTTKEYDGLRDKIKAVMKENSVRQGYAGEYVCELKLQKNNTERLYIKNMYKLEKGESDNG